MPTNKIKESILKKFHDMAYTFGIRRVTVDMLAKECGISKKTFYQHFKDKDEIIKTFTDGISTTVREELQKIDNSTTTPIEKLDLFFEFAFNSFKDISENLLYDIQKFYPEIQEKVDKDLEEHKHLIVKTFLDGIEAGIFKKINPEFIASYVLGATNHVFKANFLLKNNLTVEDAISTFKKLVLTGVLKNH